MLARVFKSVLLSLAVFLAVWLAVLFYWQYTARMPSTGDVVLWLLALPLSLLGAYWLVRMLLRGSLGAGLAAGGAQSAAASRSRSQSGGAGVMDEKTDAAEASFRLAVLAAGLRTSQGSTGADLVAAIAERKRPELDPELKNEAGFPVPAGRIEALQTDELRVQLAELALAESGGIDIDDLDEDRLRTLLAMSEVLVELLEQADEAVKGLPSDVSPAVVAPALRVSLVLPAWWAEQERLLAVQWLRQLSVQSALEPGWLIDHFSAASGIGAWTVLDRVSLSLNRDAARPALWIVLAGESAISASCLAQWEKAGLLHDERKASGLYPGEAAAGLLVTGSSDTRFAKSAGTLLSRPSFDQRASLADGSPASNSPGLGPLVDSLLMAADLKPDVLQWLVSDADHRVSHAVELGKLREKLQHLSPESNSLLVGAACAHMGVAGALVTLAVGSHLAQEKQQAVLVVGAVQDGLACAATLTSVPQAT